MLKAVKMAKVRAICLKAVAPSLIKALHNLSVIHISESELPNTERAGPLATYDEISSRLIRIRSLREAMGSIGRSPKKKREYSDLLSDADSLLEQSAKLYSYIAAKEEAQKELEAIRSSERFISELEGLEVDFSRLSASSLQFALVRIADDKAGKAKEGLEARKKCSFISAPSKSGKSAMFLVALPNGEEAKFLEQYGAMLPLPQISSTPKKALEQLGREEDSLCEKLQASERHIGVFSDAHYANVIAVEEALSIEADRAQVATRFRSTDSLYFMEGYVEDSKYGQIEDAVKGKFSKKVHISKVQAGHDEALPTLLDNPNRSKPFEYLVEFISLPQYSEIDPTLIIAFAIPLIYALILGDAGYALLSFLLARWMVGKSQPGSLLNNVAKMWMLSAIPTFFVGIAFDEYFGFTHSHLLELLGFGSTALYQGFHRVSSLGALMAISLFIGLVHLALGFLIGAKNEWQHSRKHAYAKLSWLSIEIFGTLLICAAMFNILPFLLYPAAALLALSIAALVLTEGVLAVIEIPGLVSNVISYIRITAVGVGGLILAETINEFLLPRLELSPAGIIIFIITAAIYVSMHMAACLIAMFECFVHGARLNVVEFFGKFYKGNGIRFSPFGATRQYTEEAA